mmetsp:Transcript_12895/g.32225  ORF Transcript_12895/g.32225 Transcript_12895/m.32225 type:complete len:102 (-) Transcript_12895:88-393(-)
MADDKNVSFNAAAPGAENKEPEELDLKQEHETEDYRRRQFQTYLERKEWEIAAAAKQKPTKAPRQKAKKSKKKAQIVEVLRFDPGDTFLMPWNLREMKVVR